MSQSNEPIQLSEVKETLLATLYTRAVDYRQAQPILGDRFADELVRLIGYDFSKMRLNPNDAAAIAVRARHLDDWVRDFIARHSNSVIVHLACGLDSRVFRIDPLPSVQWFDVDFPDIIELRHRFYPERASYRLVGSSVTEPGWLDTIPDDRPVMVVAEGLSMYLSETEMRDLLGRLTAHFKRGGEIAFDVFNETAKRLGQRKTVMRHTGAVFNWTAHTPQDVLRLNAALVFVDSVSVLTSPYLRQARPLMRFLCGLAAWVPALRDMGRLFRFRFVPTA